MSFLPKPLKVIGQPIETTASTTAIAKISYAAFRDRVRPGDVIVFTGKDLPSSVVKVATQSDYVHVAIVLSIEPDREDHTCVLLAESHIDMSLPSVGTGSCLPGVQVQWLEERLKNMKQPVRWAALHPPLNAAETVKLQSWLWEIEQNKIGYDFIQAIGAGIGGVVSEKVNQTDLSALFCSELVTQALKIVGRVFPEVNPSKTTPVDVMALPCLDHAIEILHEF